MPAYLVIGFICTGLWLVFPKSFKYLVGTIVGSFGGILVWGLGTLSWSVVADHDVSWRGMSQGFICCVIVGIIVGCFLAARDS